MRKKRPSIKTSTHPLQSETSSFWSLRPRTWNLEAMQLSCHWEVVRSFAWAEPRPFHWHLVVVFSHKYQSTKRWSVPSLEVQKSKDCVKSVASQFKYRIDMMHICGKLHPLCRWKHNSSIGRVGSVKIHMPPPFLDISPCLTLWKISLRERPMLPVLISRDHLQRGHVPVDQEAIRSRGGHRACHLQMTDETSRERFTSSRPGIEETSCFSRIDLWKTKYGLIWLWFQFRAQAVHGEVRGSVSRGL